ncbi:hypothetical protein LQ938_13840 [Microbacterium sp. cx-55]|uniref:hypothetical protein n=1 Tax=unclassified Microbacterium TaxID=2609290 RepID=UPI001CBD5798|nr:MULTISPECIES: hypothetical protein [unclassified Microbacterium]MBZ4488272.1 hypothetical protein [Microbacterium sp. cx-55]MCC4909332.1 hypothetical protein [Microbacterium sp. cx-59]UGB34933.1 hypothetical protein LQ938_13840 [Microbacterium sp. cx-55]
MVTLMLDSAQLEIVMSVAERALAFRKRNVVVARSSITRVQLTDDAWTWLRGVRAPGTHIPATLASGTWRYAGGRDFALIRRRRPGVVIDLDGHDEFQRIILTTRYGVELAQALRVDGGTEPADVADLAG